jgi:hypothetical protein
MFGGAADETWAATTTPSRTQAFRRIMAQKNLGWEKQNFGNRRGKRRQMLNYPIQTAV